MSILQNSHRSSHRLGPLLEILAEKPVATVGLGTGLRSAPQVICEGQAQSTIV